MLPNIHEAKLTPDMREQRNALEIKLHQLRLKKKSMNEEAYFETLEAILIQLAEFYK